MLFSLRIKRPALFLMSFILHARSLFLLISLFPPLFYLTSWSVHFFTFVSFFPVYSHKKFILSLLCKNSVSLSIFKFSFLYSMNFCPNMLATSVLFWKKKINVILDAYIMDNCLKIQVNIFHSLKYAIERWYYFCVFLGFG